MAHMASKLGYGVWGVDWGERINFARMRQERLAKAQVTMKKYGLAACLLSRPENIRYVTATKGNDFIPQLRYSLVFAEYDPLLYEGTGVMRGDCTWVKPENIKLAYQWAQQSPGQDATWESARKFAESIKSNLKEKGLDKEKLGIDEFDEIGKQALRETGIQIVDSMPVMLEARAIKTQDEINCLKMASSIVDVSWCAIYDTIKPGVTDRELHIAGLEALLKAGAESVFPGVPMVYSSGATAHSSDKIINVGDLVVIDHFRVTYMGYNTCYYRMFIVGREPTESEKDMYKRSYERIYKVIEAIRPGATTADAAKFFKPANEKGFQHEECTWCAELGHGLGLFLYEYPIINRLWSLNHPQIFEKGMVLAIEADEADPRLGRLKLEQMVIVTETGTEIYSHWPMEGFTVAYPIYIAK